jgi:hypothetical protein
MKNRLIVATILILLTAGCSSTRTTSVMPRQDNVYQISATSDDKNDALDATLKQAKKTCKAKDMHYVVVDEQSKYQGVLSENTAKNINKAASIAEVFYFPLMFIPSLTSDDDYEVTVLFKCEP